MPQYLRRAESIQARLDGEEKREIDRERQIRGYGERRRSLSERRSRVARRTRADRGNFTLRVPELRPEDRPREGFPNAPRSRWGGNLFAAGDPLPARRFPRSLPTIGGGYRPAFCLSSPLVSPSVVASVATSRRSPLLGVDNRSYREPLSARPNRLYRDRPTFPISALAETKL